MEGTVAVTVAIMKNKGMSEGNVTVKVKITVAITAVRGAMVPGVAKARERQEKCH